MPDPSVTDRDMLAADAVLERIEELLPPGAYLPVETILITAFARHAAEVREECARRLEQHAGELRTPYGRALAQWHERDADMVARELHRQAAAIRESGRE